MKKYKNMSQKLFVKNICPNMRPNIRHNISPKLKQGFTLIEVVIYCTIFTMFAIVAIESMIWINSKLAQQEKLSEVRNQNIYKIYFANIYKRYDLHNQKIETGFRELISSSSISTPVLEEDKKLGIKFNQIQSSSKQKEKFDVSLFNSIDLGY